MLALGSITSSGPHGAFVPNLSINVARASRSDIPDPDDQRDVELRYQYFLAALEAKKRLYRGNQDAPQVVLGVVSD